MFSENERCYFTGVTIEEVLDDCEAVEYTFFINNPFLTLALKIV